MSATRDFPFATSPRSSYEGALPGSAPAGRQPSVQNGGKHGQGRSAVELQRAAEDRFSQAQESARGRGGRQGRGERSMPLGPVGDEDGAADSAARGARPRGRGDRRGSRQRSEGPEGRRSRRAVLGRELRQVPL